MAKKRKLVMSSKHGLSKELVELAKDAQQSGRSKEEFKRFIQNNRRDK